MLKHVTISIFLHFVSQFQKESLTKQSLILFNFPVEILQSDFLKNSGKEDGKIFECFDY